MESTAGRYRYVPISNGLASRGEQAFPHFWCKNIRYGMP
jgi:hypothetical protein